MDRLASMAAFVKTVDTGSYAAAAEALHLSPQMIAKHVNALESRLGARLLNRTTRRHGLTEIGKAYYDRCKIVLAQADWADALAEETQGAPRGRLRINAPLSFGTHSLMPVIALYMRRYPEVEVDLVLTDRFVDLIEEEYEAVFRVGPRIDGGVVARELAPFRQVACASPDYLLERGMPARPADLLQHACLVFASESAAPLSEWQFLDGDESVRVNVEHRLQVNNAGALLSAALNGLGIAFIAEDHARDGLRTGRLVEVLPEFGKPSRPIHLIYHPARRQTPKLKAFVSLVMSELS